MTRSSIEIGGFDMGAIERAKVTNTTPFHALIMANLSGNTPVKNNWLLRQIDRDNFEAQFATIQPSLTLSIEGQHTINLTFKTLEDFEPDALYESLNIFEQLRTLRKKLSHQDTYANTVQEINNWNVDTSTPEKKPATENSNNLLDALVSETRIRQENYSSKHSDNLAKNIIRDIVTPHLLPVSDPQQSEYIASIDHSISSLMSTLLHHPKFQALESTWQSLYTTVKRIQTGKHIKLFILDISKPNLMQAVDTDNETHSEFFKNIVEPFSKMEGAMPWSIWLGDYKIEDKAEDIYFLERMGNFAAISDISFACGVTSAIVGCQNIQKTPDPEDWQLPRDQNLINAWQFLRSNDQAKHLALLLPDILLRLPYGTKTKSIESFTYEEMTESIHSNYLWGNAVYGLLYLLAQSFDHYQWQFKPGQVNEITNLPLHIYDDEGEQTLKPCAEILMTERVAEALLQQGIMPVLSVKNKDNIRISPMISFHAEAQLIQGNWRNVFSKE